MSFKRFFENQQNSIEISIDLESHTGKVVDFENMFIELEIIEDVTNFVITGSVIFADSISLKEFLPLIGGEKIRIKFRTGEDFDWYEKEFIITKLANEEGKQGRSKFIRFYFASEEILNSYMTRFSKSYRNQAISGILNDVITSQLKTKKDLNFETSSNSINFIIPYWTPNQTIKFLMNKGISSLTKDSGYLFFENKNGFNFVTISGIFQTVPEKDIIMHRIKNDNEQSLSAYVGLVKYMTQIKTIDILQDVSLGVTGGSCYTFDYATKSFIKREMEWEKLNDRQGVSLGKNSLYVDGFINKDAQIEEFTGYINDRVFNNYDFPNSINDQTKVYLRNKNLYNILNNNSLIIGKAGDSELTCGVLVKTEQFSGEKNDYNEKMHGNYLVKAVRHKISTTSGYEQICLITKPFYNTDPNNITNVVSGKVNR
jgi:hypothetical protein